MGNILEEQTALETSLLKSNLDMFGIYQLKLGEETRDYCFEALDRLRARGLHVDRANYELVYAAPLTGCDTLDSLYEQFNIRRPADFRGHSLSVSDVIVLKKENTVTAHYVDDIGFAAIPGFLKTATKTPNRAKGDRRMNTAKTVYGTVKPGDWVIATARSHYAYLIGTVKAVDKLGTPEHETENTTGDIHVDFTAFGYPPRRIAEIESHFSALHGKEIAFGDLALDDVIMAPKMLIGLSHLGQKEITRMGNLRHNCEAFCNCFPGAALPYSDRHAELIERSERNLETYHASLAGSGHLELIEIAGNIQVMTDAFSYICRNRFEDYELAFLLQFQNPLEIIADGWSSYYGDRDVAEEMEAAFHNLMLYPEDCLASYPLVDGLSPDNGPHRFMHVDLADFIGGISLNADVQSAQDWAGIKKELWKAAASDDQYDKRRLLFVSENGIKLLHERDVLIKDSVPFDFVARHAADPGITGYFVEGESLDGDAALINVFEMGDAAGYMEHLRKTALPCDAVALSYLWDVVEADLDEYRREPEKYAELNGRPLKCIWYIPKDRCGMESLMATELSRRMEYPAGEFDNEKKGDDCHFNTQK